MEEPEAKAAFIWILGEFGSSIQVHPKQLDYSMLRSGPTTG